MSNGRKNTVCLILVAATLTLTGCVQVVRSEFTYERPSFGIRLAGPNFEYLKFGATGEADISQHLEVMKQKYEIGLVNEALNEIYVQMPQNAPTALVNVVVEISRDTTISNNGWGVVSTKSVEKYLVIRCDIVRFTGPLSGANAATAETAQNDDVDGRERAISNQARLRDAIEAHARILERLRRTGGEEYRAKIQELAELLIEQRATERI